MNFYDPRVSYSEQYVNASSKQITERCLDVQEFDGIKTGIMLRFPHDTVRMLLEKMPEIFSDIEPQKIEDMSEDGKRLHQENLNELKNHDSYPSEFAAWVDNKRTLQEHK